MDFEKHNLAVQEAPLSQSTAATTPRDEKRDSSLAATRTGPDFCCVGAQKGGTGWLYEQLRAHPDFWMPPLKELHYFDRMWRSQRAAAAPLSFVGKAEGRIRAARKRARDKRDARFLDAMESLSVRSDINLESYAELFAPKGSLLSGDITPGYSLLPDEIIER